MRAGGPCCSGRWCSAPCSPIGASSAPPRSRRNAPTPTGCASSSPTAPGCPCASRPGTLRLLAALDGDPGAVRTAFDFIWAEGRDPSERAERDALCARLGVRDYDALIAEHGVKARLHGWTDAAIAAGVFGVPTLAAGGALFWGLDAMPMAEAVLDDPGLLGRGEMGRVAALPVGVQRRGG